MKYFVAIIILISIVRAPIIKAAEPVLQYLIREPKIKSAHPPVIVLLHGLGSNEKDLFAFANQLPANFLVISLRAPYVMGKDSYQWFELSFDNNKPFANKEQAENSRLLILQSIEELKTKFKFDDKQVYLCGFSQGAAMCYYVGLTSPDKIKGIAVLSGRIIDQVKPLVKVNAQLRQLKIFIAHGTNDNVIPVKYGRDGFAYLSQIGLSPTYKEYKEAHNISATILADLNNWLK